MISFTCPSCKRRLQIEAGEPGQRVRCALCGQWTPVPSRFFLALRNAHKFLFALVSVGLVAGVALVVLSAFRHR